MCSNNRTVPITIPAKIPKISDLLSVSIAKLHLTQTMIKEGFVLKCHLADMHVLNGFSEIHFVCTK
jgi:hypothetical protein